MQESNLRPADLAKRKPVKFKEVKGDSGKLNIDFEYPDGQLTFPPKTGPFQMRINFL